MSKIVSKDQRLVTAAMNPASDYSRIVGCWCQIKGVGLTGWGVTPPLGQVLRLKSVKVYFSPERDGVGDQINYGIHVGHSRPVSAANVQAWDMVIPVYMPSGKAIQFTQTQESDTMTWQMNQLFTSKEIRFGTWINGSGLVAICEMYTFFEISEG